MAREFKEYHSKGDGPNVQAHKVTKETAGPVQVPGSVQNASEGDYLIQTSNPDTFLVTDSKTFSEQYSTRAPRSSSAKSDDSKSDSAGSVTK